MSSDSASSRSRSPRNHYRHSQRLKSASRSPKPHKRSPSPKSSKICISKLTRNVNKAHVEEIFSAYGSIKSVDLPLERINFLPRGYAYVEFNDSEDAEKAMAYMNGGWIDGQTVQVQMVLPIRPPPPRRVRSPPPPRYYRRSPPRYRRFSPPRRRPRSRSRSPPVRRRRSPSRSRSRSPPRRRRSRRSASSGSR